MAVFITDLLDKQNVLYHHSQLCTYNLSVPDLRNLITCSLQWNPFSLHVIMFTLSDKNNASIIVKKYIIIFLRSTTSITCNISSRRKLQIDISYHNLDYICDFYRYFSFWTNHTAELLQILMSISIRNRDGIVKFVNFLSMEVVAEYCVSSQNEQISTHHILDAWRLNDVET